MAIENFLKLEFMCLNLFISLIFLSFCMINWPDLGLKMNFEDCSQEITQLCLFYWSNRNWNLLKSHLQHFSFPSETDRFLMMIQEVREFDFRLRWPFHLINSLKISLLEYFVRDAIFYRTQFMMAIENFLKLEFMCLNLCISLIFLSFCLINWPVLNLKTDFQYCSQEITQLCMFCWSNRNWTLLKSHFQHLSFPSETDRFLMMIHEVREFDFRLRCPFHLINSLKSSLLGFSQIQTSPNPHRIRQ